MTEKQINELLIKHKFQKSENNFSRISVEYENAAIQRIKEGRAKELSFLDYEDIKDHIGATASTPMKTYEYSTVAAITLFTRAAIDGGVRPEAAYDLGEVLLQLLDKANSIQEMQEIFHYSEILFARMVRSVRKPSTPYQIDMCRTFIAEHIFQKLQVSDVAEHVGLSPHYLSTLFAQYEGVPLKDYIQREKIHSACNMLCYSNDSIADIALKFGYKSQSKFSEVFQKWKGMTPSEYRKLNHNSASL